MNDEMHMHTLRLQAGTGLLRLEREAFGSRLDAGLIGFVPLPLSADPESTVTTRWQALLQLTGSNQGLLAFEFLDDVIVGRDSDVSDAPDLDMSILDAQNLGVSRRHAMFRPTDNHLYLIDLGSTNGTLVNGYPIGAGRAHPLSKGDHISFAKLNMDVGRLDKVPGEKPRPSTDKLPKPPTKEGKSDGKPTDRLQDEE